MQLRKEADIGRGWLLLRIYLKRMSEQQIGRLPSLHGHGNLYNITPTETILKDGRKKTVYLGRTGFFKSKTQRTYSCSRKGEKNRHEWLNWQILFRREYLGGLANTKTTAIKEWPNRGTQRKYSSKPLKHSIDERILVFKR